MTNSVNGPGMPRLMAIPPAAVPVDGQATAADGVNFKGLLLGSLSETNALDMSAQSAIQDSLAGGDISKVEVFSAVKKADLALRMMVQIRNKLFEAYEEVKRMQM